MTENPLSEAVPAPDHRYEPQAYWETLLSDSFDTSGVAYAYLAVSFNEALYRAERDVAGRALAAYPPARPLNSALDVGCGTGIWIDFWHRQGVSHITGVDLTAASIARLRARDAQSELVQADVGEAGLDLGRTFDAITAMSVLLHIVDPGRLSSAVENLARHLAPGGRLLLIEPVIVDGWWGGEFGPEANSRIRTIETWSVELGRHGLELLDCRPVTFLLANPIDARTERLFGFWMRYWRYVLRVVAKHERIGAVAGRVLEVLDRPLRRRLRPGPSAKLLVVGHRSEAGAR